MIKLMISAKSLMMSLMTRLWLMMKSSYKLRRIRNRRSLRISWERVSSNKLSRGRLRRDTILGSAATSATRPSMGAHSGTTV